MDASTPQSPVLFSLLSSIHPSKTFFSVATHIFSTKNVPFVVRDRLDSSEAQTHVVSSSLSHCGRVNRQNFGRHWRLSHVSSHAAALYRDINHVVENNEQISFLDQWMIAINPNTVILWCLLSLLSLNPQSSFSLAFFPLRRVFYSTHNRPFKAPSVTTPGIDVWLCGRPSARRASLLTLMGGTAREH